MHVFEIILAHLYLDPWYRLLDRERVGDEEPTLDEEDDNEFLKAFKVCIWVHFLCLNVNLVCPSWLINLFLLFGCIVFGVGIEFIEFM